MLFFSDMGFWFFIFIFLGVLQYLLYGPFLAKVLYSRIQEETIEESWCLHILIICVLRASIYQYWTSWSNMLFLTRNRRILPQGVDFKQIDKEWDWYLLVSALDFYSLFFPMAKMGFCFIYTDIAFGFRFLVFELTGIFSSSSDFLLTFCCF